MVLLLIINDDIFLSNDDASTVAMDNLDRSRLSRDEIEQQILGCCENYMSLEQIALQYTERFASRYKDLHGVQLKTDTGTFCRRSPETRLYRIVSVRPKLMIVSEKNGRMYCYTRPFFVQFYGSRFIRRVETMRFPVSGPPLRAPVYRSVRFCRR